MSIKNDEREKENVFPWGKNMTDANNRFYNFLAKEIQDFQVKVERKFGSVRSPKNVNPTTAAIINQKVGDIQKCFPEAPTYVRM